MTGAEIATAIGTAYRNSKFDIKNIEVYNGATGEPVVGATISIYSDWYAFNSANSSAADFVYTTDSNGESD